MRVSFIFVRNIPLSGYRFYRKFMTKHRMKAKKKALFFSKKNLVIYELRKLGLIAFDFFNDKITTIEIFYFESSLISRNKKKTFLFISRSAIRRDCDEAWISRLSGERGGLLRWTGSVREQAITSENNYRLTRPRGPPSRLFLCPGIPVTGNDFTREASFAVRNGEQNNGEKGRKRERRMLVLNDTPRNRHGN